MQGDAFGGKVAEIVAADPEVPFPLSTLTLPRLVTGIERPSRRRTGGSAIGCHPPPEPRCGSLKSVRGRKLLVLLGFLAQRHYLRGTRFEFWWLQSTPPLPI